MNMLALLSETQIDYVMQLNREVLSQFLIDKPTPEDIVKKLKMEHSPDKYYYMLKYDNEYLGKVTYGYELKKDSIFTFEFDLLFEHIKAMN